MLEAVCRNAQIATRPAANEGAGCSLTDEVFALQQSPFCAACAKAVENAELN